MPKETRCQAGYPIAGRNQTGTAYVVRSTGVIVDCSLPGECIVRQVITSSRSRSESVSAVCTQCKEEKTATTTKEPKKKQ